ncbi:MAG: RHS repeat-associated core domain-containing protein, partial [Muribaculaceae bacterium]|nr:RHS repeat-associated core domain-containing protein [Muribaculaceae bacterium]
YFPYGEPFREPSHPYTFSDNERLHAGGQNQYDFHARRLIPTLLRFDNPDPLMEKYPHLSPYLYCAGNPIANVDQDGRDIVVLKGSVHIAMLIQDENKKWRYYSINGAGKQCSGVDIGGRRFNDVEMGPWESPQEFFDSEYNQKIEADGIVSNSSSLCSLVNSPYKMIKGIEDPSKDDPNYNNYGYTEGYQIESTPEQDAVMREEFNKLAKTDYNLWSNNCATTVQDVMEKGGLKSPSSINIKVNVNIQGINLININVDKKIGYRFSIPFVAYGAIKALNPEGIPLSK